jgi:hypothetical protein
MLLRASVRSGRRAATASAGVAAAEAAAAAGATAEVTERTGAPALVEARQQALLIAALRGALALAGVIASIALGLDPAPALGLLVFGAGIVLLAVYGGDKRRRSALRFEDPEPVPPDAHMLEPGRGLAQAAYPSTVGLAVLTAVAVWPRPDLAALLAGILAGLAVMSTIGAARVAGWERARGARILVDYKANRVFEAPR